MRRQAEILWAFGACMFAFVAIQFIRPEIKNPPVTAELQAPEEVKQILRTSCYNCHSNETRLPWYDKAAPAYWLVAHDVQEGRKSLNFSEIGKLPFAQQKAALFESVNQIQLGAMPLPSYRFVHHESVLTPEQLSILRGYLAPIGGTKVATAQDRDAADHQRQQWMEKSKQQLSVSPAPNGIAFLPDYKNWKAVSSTERFDNHTLRVILGNDVAVKAIAERKINPWPDGAAFAKVAWSQQEEENGLVHSGAFLQVEFMIRDSKKYSSTKGWGWARWKGTDLKPYGSNAGFVKECISCHMPVKKNDYVFTLPLGGQQ